MTEENKARVNICFVLFPDVTQLDMTGPAQVLANWPAATLHYAARTIDPVPTDSGFSIVPTVTFWECPQADIIIVPGGYGVLKAMQCQDLRGFIMSQMAKHKIVGSGKITICSVCTGALILKTIPDLFPRDRADSEVTTHWGYMDCLGKEYGSSSGDKKLFYQINRAYRPIVTVDDDDEEDKHRAAGLPTYAKDRHRVVSSNTNQAHIINAGGVTSGIDFAFELIASHPLGGADVSKQIACAMEYAPDPKWAQYGHPALEKWDEDKDSRQLKQKICDRYAQRNETYHKTLGELARKDEEEGWGTACLKNY
eukprot:Clim_evm22s229 gene=Clim_evmTU22s229